MQAVLAENALRCQLCGTAEWEWEHAGSYVPIEVVCLGCAAKDRGRESSDTGRATPGASIRLVPAEVAERRQRTPVQRPKSPRELAREAQT